MFHAGHESAPVDQRDHERLSTALPMEGCHGATVYAAYHRRLHVLQLLDGSREERLGQELTALPEARQGHILPVHDRERDGDWHRLHIEHRQLS